jgi:hypothetical protein
MSTSKPGASTRVTTSKLPRRLAVIGIIVGFAFMTASSYVDKYNPFHLPTVAQAERMGSFSEPALERLFDDLTFALCPGSVLFFFSMDLRDAASYFMWVVVALINGPIYYCLGLIFVTLTKHRSQVPVP